MNNSAGTGRHNNAKIIDKEAMIFRLKVIEDKSSRGPAWPVLEYIRRINIAKNQNPKSTISPALI